MIEARTARGCSATAALVAVTLCVPLAVRGSEGLDSTDARGAAVFSTYCVLCHGVEGKGDGRGAALQKARPADLTNNVSSAAYQLQIVRDGGGSLQRSPGMPAWREVLTEQQIADVVAYLQTLSAAARTSGANAATPTTAQEIPQ